jgi:hypothetical protein
MPAQVSEMRLITAVDWSKCIAWIIGILKTYICSRIPTAAPPTVLERIWILDILDTGRGLIINGMHATYICISPGGVSPITMSHSDIRRDLKTDIKLVSFIHIMKDKHRAGACSIEISPRPLLERQYWQGPGRAKGGQHDGGCFWMLTPHNLSHCFPYRRRFLISAIYLPSDNNCNHLAVSWTTLDSRARKWRKTRRKSGDLGIPIAIVTWIAIVIIFRPSMKLYLSWKMKENSG